MKRIVSYTLGWDTNTKKGYISLLDDKNQTHHLADLPADEFTVLLTMLKNNELYIDKQKWIIQNWIP